MKHPPSSFFLVIQVGVIVCITVLVVWFFFQLRPSILPVPTLQSSLHTLLESSAPAVVMIINQEKIIGVGSCINERTIITSKHLIHSGQRYSVRFSDKNTSWVTPIFLSEESDIALLWSDRPCTSFLETISSQALLKPGDFVVAYWALPTSSVFISHFGSISALDQYVSIDDQSLKGLILTDIPFQAWYSGWPLLNLQGELIGIHTAYASRENIWWSTPIDASLLVELQKNVTS
jgi:S1-C subfamily serine protease